MYKELIVKKLQGLYDRGKIRLEQIAEEYKSHIIKRDEVIGSNKV